MLFNISLMCLMSTENNVILCWWLWLPWKYQERFKVSISLNDIMISMVKYSYTFSEKGVKHEFFPII